jgi:hypothetical protein
VSKTLVTEEGVELSSDTIQEAQARGIEAIIKNIDFLVDACGAVGMRYETKVPACTALALSVDTLTRYSQSQHA